VNEQLDKVDQITDSAVDAVAGVDTAVRTVTGLVTRPIERLAGLVAGASHTVSSMRAGGDWREAVRTGREEASRREQDLSAELEEEE
jgi:phage tail tape-measure protein